jgi:hypothetical protein
MIRSNEEEKDYLSRRDVLCLGFDEAEIPQILTSSKV